MKTQVTKSKFKAKVLELLRKIEHTGESVIVTNRGKPSVEVRPYRRCEVEPLTRLKGSVLLYRAPIRPVAEKGWEMGLRSVMESPSRKRRPSS